MASKASEPGQLEERVEASQAGCARGTVETLPRLSGYDFPQGGGEAAGGLSRVRLPLVRARPAADSPGAQRRHVRGMGRRSGDLPTRCNSSRHYPQKVEAEQKRTGLREAAVVGTGMIRGRRVAFGVTNSAFIMGSMGSVVGEKLTRTIERTIAMELPIPIIVSGSGGVLLFGVPGEYTNV